MPIKGFMHFRQNLLLGEKNVLIKKEQMQDAALFASELLTRTILEVV